MAQLGFTNHLFNEVDFLSKADIKSIAGKLLKSTKLSIELLENLLLWARIKMGRIAFEPEVINLKNTINSIAELFNSGTESKNITLTLDIQNELQTFADLNMFETVLRNLISNSIKFTSEGGRISVSVIEVKDFITISVSDTGVGMDSDKIEKLFQTGQSISTLGTQNEKGSGLGLLLCKEFVELNKGKISVKSKCNEGSTFSFTVPKYDLGNQGLQKV
jgi:signal transduction histidine kinase